MITRYHSAQGRTAAAASCDGSDGARRNPEPGSRVRRDRDRRSIPATQASCPARAAGWLNGTLLCSLNTLADAVPLGRVRGGRSGPTPCHSDVRALGALHCGVRNLYLIPKGEDPTMHAWVGVVLVGRISRISVPNPQSDTFHQGSPEGSESCAII